MKKNFVKKFNQGFTLVELMIVVIVMAILSAIALPSYQVYARKSDTASVQQEIMKLADQLERHKTRNFNYKNFTPTSVSVNRGGYTINITDDTIAGNLLNSSATTGQNWAIKATSTNPKNISILAKSSGLRCQSSIAVNVDNNCSGSVCTSCETGSEAW